MSTNGIIAKATGEGTFEGVWHHWDSNPQSLGKVLVELYQGHFKRDYDKMLKTLLEEHVGWSSIVDKDFKLKPGYTNPRSRPEGMSFDEFLQLPMQRRPQCFCHGERHETAEKYTEKDTSAGVEWAYVFENEDNQPTMHIIYPERNEAGEKSWKDATRIELNSADAIDWKKIECGENLERCTHYAWYHNLVPKTCNLSTQTWLENKPLEFHDVIAVIVGGKRYAMTGCGGSSEFYSTPLARQHGFTGNYPRGTWVSSVRARNGKRLDIAVAKIEGNKYLPLPGITFIYPPTKNNPSETKVST